MWTIFQSVLEMLKTSLMHHRHISPYVRESKTNSTSWIPDSRHLIPVFFSGIWILDFNPYKDSRFLELYSRFQNPGFQISQAKLSQIPESGFPCIGQENISLKTIPTNSTSVYLPSWKCYIRWIRSLERILSYVYRFKTSHKVVIPNTKMLLKINLLFVFLLHSKRRLVKLVCFYTMQCVLRYWNDGARPHLY